MATPFPRPSGPRWPLALVAAAAVVIGAFALDARGDAYGPGTQHDTVLDPGSDAAECGVDWGLRLGDGSVWVPTGTVPLPVTDVPVPGTLVIETATAGRFESAPADVDMTPGSFATECTPPR